MQRPALFLTFLQLALFVNVAAVAQTTSPLTLTVPAFVLERPIPGLSVGTNPRLPIAIGRVVAPGTVLPPVTDSSLPVAQGRIVAGAFMTPVTDVRLPIAGGLAPTPGSVRPPVDLSKVPIASGRVLPQGAATFGPPNPGLPIAQGFELAPIGDAKP